MLVTGITSYTSNRNVQSFGAVSIPPDLKRVCGINKDDMKVLNRNCPKNFDIDVYIDGDGSTYTDLTVYAKIFKCEFKGDKSEPYNNKYIGSYKYGNNKDRQICKSRLLFELDLILEDLNKT